MNRFLITILLAAWSSQQAQPRQELRQEAGEHIHQLAASLPLNSELRYLLDQGVRGDGIRYPWMDDLRRQGMKLAEFTFDFAWAQHGKERKEWHPVRIKYWHDYDQSDPITDSNQLEAIRNSGLENELLEAALTRAKSAFWFERPRDRSGIGFYTVLLWDDEWLPTSYRPWLGQYTKGATPLMRASLVDDLGRVRELLAQGANVNERDSEGETALMYAMENDNPDLVNSLLAAGANVNAKARDGANALASAVMGNFPRIVSLLLKAGADPNSRNADRESVLSISTRKHYTEIVQLLSRAGARQ